MSIKQKIRLGTFFLFLLLAVSSSISLFYLTRLRTEATEVLKDNYISLKFAKDMQRFADSFAFAPEYTAKFDSLLQLQEKNITEKGEKAATDSVRFYFNQYQQDKAGYEAIRYHLLQITELNMLAIERKSVQAEKSGETGKTILVVILSITLIVGFTFAYNFPFIITSPIKKLTEGIRQIASKNYQHRVHIDSKDEMGELANAFNRMSERLEEFESSNLNKLIFEKARAEAVINSLKDASIGIDANAHVLFANQHALQLLGLSAPAIVGKAVKDVEAKNELFAFLMQNEATTPFKIVVAGKENYYVREVVDINGGESKVIALKNITSFKELDAAKTNFIATISHELKTPLSSSDFSLKLLENTKVGPLTPEQKELVVQLKTNNARMLRILSELLNLTQAESGKLGIKPQSVTFADLVAESVNAVQAVAREKKISIDVMVEHDMPDIQTDPDKTGWVLNNFLTNAIRYSPAGSRISVSAFLKEEKLTCEVTDNGEGIEPAYISRIFDRYFQVPGNTNKQGSGIGLAICREFIEAMGGTIYVRSEKGKGSSFGFCLPVEWPIHPNAGKEI